MQAPPGGSQRRPQQRSPPPGSHDGPPPYPAGTTAAAAAAAGPGVRASSGSGKASSRRKDLSQIEKSVTHLLVATKQLLETLTQWSRGQATEGQVSDVYVRLGYEFNIACRAFTSIGVAVDDLGPVPDQLRAILEETLSQEASPQSLDRFLPKIRDIIINLLHGLKKKQSKLRAARAKEGGSSSAADGDRTSSYAQHSTTSSGSSRQDGIEDQDNTPHPRASIRSNPASYAGPESADLSGGGVRTRTSPTDSGPDQDRFDRDARRRESLRERYSTINDDHDALPEPPSSHQSTSAVSSMDRNGSVQGISFHGETPAPPPPPKQDALAALQRGGELERRASRRYSAYQISKHLGASPGGVPMIPPPQHSPVPNRGRDAQESLNAVRTRSSLLSSQPRSPAVKEISPGRSAANRTSLAPKTPEASRSALRDPVDGNEPSPFGAVGPEPSSNSLERPGQPSAEDRLAMSGTVNGPVDAYGYQAPSTNQSTLPRPSPTSTPAASARTPTSAGPAPFVPEQSPQPGKELTLFLQYRHRIKKIVLAEGLSELSVARLQLAFIEKFAWNTHNNGVDLPEIYIQDSVSGVRHELDDLSDIKDRSVLVLNVEPLDEVKRHIDENLGGIRKMMEGMKASIDGQQLVINQVSDRQQDSAKDIARIATAPPAVRSNTLPQSSGRPLVVADSAVRDVQTLRRDLAIMRQTLSSFSTTVQSSVAAIRTKAETVKAKAIDVAIPVFDSDSGRSYVTNGKKSLSDDSDTLVNRVDDLQDLVEDLRKDVVSRGVRPLPRQLESANKDISEATKELKKMQDYVKREKPTWTKIWEKELEVVCNDREFLTLQEDLIADLEDDLEKATQTMTLVEQAMKQQNLQSSSTGTVPALRHVPNIDTVDVDPHAAKTGVLGQVRALQPNHESRIEAIERAEKARARELESRQRDAAFKRELGAFVADSKLKKSGGVEEMERVRRQKDERAMRGEYEDQQQRKAERAKARAEERARLAAASQNTSISDADPPGDDETGEVGREGRYSDGPAEGLEQGSDESREAEAEADALTPASPAGRKSWLPSFMSGGSNN